MVSPWTDLPYFISLDPYDGLLDCFHYFANIIRPVVNVLSLGISVGQVPIIKTAKLKDVHLKF